MQVKTAPDDVKQVRDIAEEKVRVEPPCAFCVAFSPLKGMVTLSEGVHYEPMITVDLDEEENEALVALVDALEDLDGTIHVRVTALGQSDRVDVEEVIHNAKQVKEAEE